MSASTSSITLRNTPQDVDPLLPLPSDDDALIRARDVSRYTGIAQQTHTRWRHEGVGPKFARLGGRVFYRAGDLREWIRSRVRQNTIDAA